MQQQINLYKFLPKKPDFVLTKKIVLLSYTTFLMLLLMLHFIVLWQKHKLNIQLDKLNNEMSLYQQQLTMLTQKYPVTDLDTIKKNIHQLQEEYEKKSNAIDLLLPDANFSTYLLGLGNAIVPGVWLTQIIFNRGEPKIALKGYTLHPALLEQFYSQLANQPIFSKLTFKLNELKQTGFPANFYITAQKANKV